MPGKFFSVFSISLLLLSGGSIISADDINPASEFRPPMRLQADDLLEMETSSVDQPQSLGREKSFQAKTPLLEAEIIEPETVNQSPVHADNSTRKKLVISSQKENHLLITVGDLVYLKTAEKGLVGKSRRYIIYKEVTKKLPNISKRPIILYKPIGKLKILEINQPLSLAKIIAACEVIRKGDFVFSGK